jgi:hypothetical protein
MKQPREAAPIWVWLAFGLMGPGTASYVAGYMVLEDILGFPLSGRLRSFPLTASGDRTGERARYPTCVGRTSAPSRSLRGGRRNRRRVDRA